MNKRIILRIIANNIVGESSFLAEHGISILIQILTDEIKESHLLDCGKTDSTLLHNLEASGIEIAKLSLNTVILSHGHYDHTGGLKGLLEKSPKPIPIIGHSDVFIPRISYTGGFRTISCPFTQSEIRQEGGELLLTHAPVKINELLSTTGQVPRKNKYEINPDFRKVLNGNWVKDEVNDDLSLVISVNRDSFFLLCGCCHAGLINTLERVREITGKEKCYGIMGGLHLINASRERINFTINHLKEWDPEVIIPLHCSGTEFMCELKYHFPKKTKFLSCGDSFSLQVD